MQSILYNEKMKKRNSYENIINKIKCIQHYSYTELLNFIYIIASPFLALAIKLKIMP